MNAAYVNYAEKAIEEIRSITNMTFTWWPPAGEEMPASVDIIINERLVKLEAITSRKANADLLAKLVGLNESKRKNIVVAGVIPTSLQQAFRQHKVNYVDAAGNCFIEQEGIFILVEGRKPIVVPPLGTQLFNKSGLRILFTLLIQPDAIILTVRNLAKRAGVSVGTAQQTLESFRQSGYIVALDNQRQKLVSKNTLLGQWVDRYGDRLKPSLSIGRYRLPSGIHPADWRQINLQAGSYWGGEAAADALTNKLRPAELIIYTEENSVDLIKKYRIIPDPQGRLEVNQLFWSPIGQHITDVPVVPPLLIYADLMANTDPRVGEVARLIYLDYVQNQF